MLIGIGRLLGADYRPIIIIQCLISASLQITHSIWNLYYKDPSIYGTHYFHLNKEVKRGGCRLYMGLLSCELLNTFHLLQICISSIQATKN